MSNIPCQECGNEFDLNTAKAVVNRRGVIVAPPICLVCIDDMGFTLYEDEFRENHLKKAEGRAAEVERVARITWNRYKASEQPFERALIEYAYDRARHVLMHHPRRDSNTYYGAGSLAVAVLNEKTDVHEFVNPYVELCPKPGQSLSEYLKERKWPEGILPLPLSLGKQILPHEHGIIRLQPYTFCKPYMLMVDTCTSMYFEIHDIRQRNRSLFIATGPVPASLFDEPGDDNQSIALDFRSMGPAEILSIDVKNISDYPWDFRGCVLCITEERLVRD